VQTTGDLPNYDEPLDIRKLSYENIDVICEIAGRSRRALEQELVAAHSHGREVWVLVNNPLFVLLRSQVERGDGLVADLRGAQEADVARLPRQREPAVHRDRSEAG
jgi:hypothetical protein